ncbi:hypothetical protein U0C82_17920 [Fulvimarina sp. 2208YS6-2-32]|uniref:Uncharacterized protein n=1 Tax=Fulvimarina uroteuthidis TaxID=3098149 RepID=A0ABU5I730_9HYPH|nr:hypothetical protein [Fulvimarina sp. 2208YS6-2-32]MDY8111011.1 hypothetical protein [Fulvimarina sp. 2208YS6-2-32]
MTIISSTSGAARRLALAAPIGIMLLAGCNTSTPYPSGTPIEGARISANPFPRGTPEFCAQYARQTAANEYEARIDRSEDGFGIRQLTEQQARRDGARAYQRCLDRR